MCVTSTHIQDGIFVVLEFLFHDWVKDLHVNDLRRSAQHRIEEVQRDRRMLRIAEQLFAGKINERVDTNGHPGLGSPVMRTGSPGSKRSPDYPRSSSSAPPAETPAIMLCTTGSIPTSKARLIPHARRRSATTS